MLGEKPSYERIESPLNLGSRVLVLSDTTSGGGRNTGNISLGECRQILKKTERIENLVKTGKMCKMAGSSPIYR